MKISDLLLSCIHPRGSADPDTPPQTALAGELKRAQNSDANAALLRAAPSPSAARSRAHDSALNQARRRFATAAPAGVDPAFKPAQQRFAHWLNQQPLNTWRQLLHNHQAREVHAFIDAHTEDMARRDLARMPGADAKALIQAYREAMIAAAAQLYPQQAERFRQGGVSTLSQQLEQLSQQAGLDCSNKRPLQQQALQELIRATADQIADALEQTKPQLLRKALEQASNAYQAHPAATRRQAACQAAAQTLSGEREANDQNTLGLSLRRAGGARLSRRHYDSIRLSRETFAQRRITLGKRAG